MNREPAALTTGIGALLASIAQLVVVLNIVTWDANQLAIVNLVITNLIFVLGALFIRSQVTPANAPHITEGTIITVTDAEGTKTKEITA